MKRVDCVGMVGKYPTPKGLVMFWDTGKSVSPVQLAESQAIQHAVYNSSNKDRTRAMEKAGKIVMELARAANVYPEGFAVLADDGRMLVTEPWYFEEESEKREDDR